MAVLTASYSVEIKPAGSWTALAAADVLSVRGALEVTGDRDHALAFGDASELTCEIETLGSVWASLTIHPCPVRVTFTIGATPAKAFVGIITEKRRDLDRVMLRCQGAAALMRVTKAYSPIVQDRPIATATSAASVEDPSDGSYQAGLLNWLFWQAGGRPYEQDFTYPAPIFYYSCEQAILAPDYSWTAGEDSWAEALRLAQAAGGQVFQDGAGVVRYRQPVGAGTSPTYTFTESVYAGIEESVSDRPLATKVICSYVPRAARPLQDVVSDDTPRLIPAGDTETINLEPQWPLTSVEQATAGQLKPEAITVTWFDGRTVTQGAGGYTHTLTIAAQRVTLAVTNDSSQPIMLHRVTLRGTPVTAGEPGTVSVGAGTIERVIADNPLIQSRGHAERLARMTYATTATARSVRTITGNPFDPSRTVGEVVGLTCSAWSLTAVNHQVLAIRHDETGATSDYDLVDVTGLPVLSDYYIVGATDYTGQTKKLSY